MASCSTIRSLRRSPVSRSSVLALAGTVAALALAACGSGDETEPNVQKQASAGSNAVVCPNTRSTNTALTVSNRLDLPVIFKASSINCAQWSERGNPSVLDGRVIEAGGEIRTPGLEPANNTTPKFLVWVKSDRANLLHAEVKASGGSILVKGWNTDKEWSSSTTQLNKTFGKRVQVSASGAPGTPPTWNLTFSYPP